VLVWAIAVTALGLLYVLLARAWPHVFSRGFVETGKPVPEGWQLGRAIAWRLPTRLSLAALVVAVIPVPAALVIEGPWLAIILSFASFIFVSLWLVASPGHRMGVFEAPGSPDRLFFIIRADRQPVRSIAVFALFGLLPSLLIAFTIARALESP
jgi:hypothetical protein